MYQLVFKTDMGIISNLYMVKWHLKVRSYWRLNLEEPKVLDCLYSLYKPDLWVPNKNKKDMNIWVWNWFKLRGLEFHNLSVL